MTSLPDIDPDFRSELLRRAPEATTVWLAELDSLWDRCCRAWALTAAGPASHGRTSLVLPVSTRTGVPAALKLVSPVAESGAEIAALTAFGGDGAVALLAADVEWGALLLEHLTGPPLTVVDPDTAMAVAGEVAARLMAAAPPRGTPTMAAQAPGWLAQLRNQHRFAARNGYALPDELVERAARTIADLTHDRSSVLTHGDLSLDNILRSPRGWLAIDPLLVAGNPEREAHTLTRSRLRTALDSDDPAATMARWSDRFCAVAGLDPGLARAVSYARFVASYYWESQHAGHPGDVAALLRITDAMARTMD